MTDDHAGAGLDAAASLSRSDDGVAAQAQSATMSLELAYSLLATEHMWRLLDAEFGLLTEREVAQLLQVPPTARNWFSERRKAGQIIGVRRGNSYRYFGFQFDRELSVILPFVETLLDLARVNEWTTESLSLWMLSPSTSFAGEGRPVDHLREPEAVLAAAKLQMEELW
ncbi:helix-turn-helix domain-containing protein [Cryobacterium sp. Hh38]|uniref:helix-turn-helix domain-containing protein n=1 Tax=Cryobacterium sp. Hh38 TaxID=1259156 RepID=UPI00106C882D|nr:helix-turn-helix domain-containing protein [Cryobacterium sp. Hh38]TFD66081.1 DNA-binding protein [Cryobacterium sp. Hh38]